MARGTPTVGSNLSGGLNVSADPLELKNGQSPDCMNVRSGPNAGALRKRQGILDLTDGTDFDFAPRKLAVYQSGATTRLVVMGSKVKVLEPGSAPTAGPSSSTLRPWVWCSASAAAVGAQGPLYLMSDTDKLWFNGTTFGTWTAASGTIPTGRCMTVYENYLYVGGMPDAAVRWSAVGDPRAWPVANETRLEPFQGDRVTALCVAGDALYAFKRDSVFRIHDGETSANVKVTNAAGTIYRDSVVATDYGVLFLDPERGVMRLTGSGVTEIGGPVLPLLRALPATEQGQFAVAAAYWEGSYWLSIPTTSGAPSVLLEYDLQDGAWWRHDCPAWDLKVASFGQSPDTWLRREALVGAVPSEALTAAGLPAPPVHRVYQIMRPGLWADTVSGRPSLPVVWRWRSSVATFDGDPHIRKRLAQLRVDAVGAGEIRVAKDFNVPGAAKPFGTSMAEGSAMWGQTDSGVWGVQSGNERWGGVGVVVRQHRFYTLGTARTAQIQIQGRGASDFQLHSYAWFIGPQRRTD